MGRGYSFSPELLRMMLSEERQKFVAALGVEASWKELNRIRKTINQLNGLLDAENRLEDGDPSGNNRHNKNNGRRGAERGSR
ncbi:MAG: hypothetical protein H7122_17505 [Chitinophagaceae bacterium]|nr:hypothetical protein [Chitinophagaceae bacterium]